MTPRPLRDPLTEAELSPFDLSGPADLPFPREEFRSFEEFDSLSLIAGAGSGHAPCIDTLALLSDRDARALDLNLPTFREVLALIFGAIGRLTHRHLGPHPERRSSAEIRGDGATADCHRNLPA